jgi:hypothetical protein
MRECDSENVVISNAPYSSSIDYIFKIRQSANSPTRQLQIRCGEPEFLHTGLDFRAGLHQVP